jgi:hypothetical protein
MHTWYTEIVKLCYECQNISRYVNICQLLPVVVGKFVQIPHKKCPIQIIRGIRGVTAVLYIAKSSKKPVTEVFCKIW